MDINNQINKLRESIFEKSFKDNINKFREEMIDLLNATITKWEFDRKTVLNPDQRKQAKLLILQQKILPIVANPMQKSIIIALIGEFN